MAYLKASIALASLIALFAIAGCNPPPEKTETVVVFKKLTDPAIPDTCKVAGRKAYPSVTASNKDGSADVVDFARTVVAGRGSDAQNFVRELRCDCFISAQWGTQADKDRLGNMCSPNFLSALDKEIGAQMKASAKKVVNH